MKTSRNIPRSRMQPIRCALIAALAWTIIPSAASARPEIPSRWRDRDIAVDGQDPEWTEARTYIKDARMSVAAYNDDQHLYLCIMTNQQQVLRQAMMHGLTLWLDPDGGKDKEFGIRFPVGMPGDPSMRMSRGAEPDTAEIRRRFEQGITEIEIVGPEKDHTRRMPVKAIVGVNAAITALTEGFVYELRIPLVRTDDHPFAVGIDNTEEIGLGVEIPVPEIDRSTMAQSGGMSGRGGFGGGRGGGGRGGGKGGRGGRSGGDRPERPEPVDAWAKVKLATDPGTVTESDDSSE